jgi:hypothetical protein
MAAWPGWHNRVMTNMQDIPSLLSCAKKFADLQVIQTQLPGETTA